MGHQYSDWSDRRHASRWHEQSGDAGFWVPDRSEIFTQFFTRYLFFALALRSVRMDPQVTLTATTPRHRGTRAGPSGRPRRQSP